MPVTVLTGFLGAVQTTNQTFHQSLIESDPLIGYKNDAWMIAEFKEAKLELIKVVPMPAYNLVFICDKPRMWEEKDAINRSP